MKLPSQQSRAREASNRIALIDAAIGEVTALASVKVTFRNVSRRAGVSSRIARKLFIDTDNLIVEAAKSLAATALTPATTDSPTVESAMAVASAFLHQFEDHRGFYTAIFRSSLSPALNEMMNVAVGPFNRMLLHLASGVSGDTPQTHEDVAFVTERSRRLVTTWLMDPEPDENADVIVRRLRNFVMQLAAGQKPA